MKKDATILAVDDNPRNLQLLSSLLMANGYKVVVANSGENALKYLELKLPDLVLLDIMMPGISGFEVLEMMKANPSMAEIPVIFLTAKTELDDIVQGFEEGAVDYITKPFRSEELLARVATHIELKMMRSLLAEKNTRLQTLNQELMLSQETIHNNNERLAALNAEKDKFFSIISHDLRNPFNGCLMAAEILATRFQDLSQIEVTSFVDALYSSATNIKKLLDNLLKWAQIQMGTLESNIQPLFVNKHVLEAMTMQQVAADEKNITLRFNPSETLKAMADADMLDMILRNLVSNAIKFTPVNGSVEISISDTASGVEISVKDSGIGMSKELLARLFRISEKVSRPGTKGEQSTGIGLILSNDLALRMGGSLRVSSTVNKGSSFVLALQKA